MWQVYLYWRSRADMTLFACWTQKVRRVPRSICCRLDPVRSGRICRRERAIAGASDYSALDLIWETTDTDWLFGREAPQVTYRAVASAYAAAQEDGAERCATRRIARFEFIGNIERFVGRRWARSRGAAAQFDRSSIAEQIVLKALDGVERSEVGITLKLAPPQTCRRWFSLRVLSGDAKLAEGDVALLTHHSPR